MWAHIESDRFHCAVIQASVLGTRALSLGDWCPTAEDQYIILNLFLITNQMHQLFKFILLFCFVTE